MIDADSNPTFGSSSSPFEDWIYLFTTIIVEHEIPSTYEEIMKCLPRLMMSVFGHTEHLDKAKEDVKSYFLKTEAPQMSEVDTWSKTIEAVRPLSLLLTSKATDVTIN